MKEKRIGVIITTLLLIIAVVVIVIMGYKIYNLSNNAQEKNNEINTLKEEKQKIKTTLEEIQNSLNNINNSQDSKLNTNSPSEVEEEEIKEIAKNFIEAVNKKDWDIVERYSDSGIVSTIKQYNISNMNIKDYSDYKYYKEYNEYVYTISYDMQYEGSTNPKDFGLGYGFIIEKRDGKFVVSTPFATGI